MTLSFPTLAEQAFAQFRHSKRTVSLVPICDGLGGERRVFYSNGKVIEYTFDDDSSLQIRGVGRNHKVQTFLP